MGPTALAGRYCGPPGQPCPPPSIRYTTTGGHPGADQVSRVTGGSPGASGSRSSTGSPLIPALVAQSRATVSVAAARRCDGGSPCRAARHSSSTAAVVSVAW